MLVVVEEGVALVVLEVSFEGTTDVISSSCLVVVASASSAVATMGSLTIISVVEAVVAVAEDVAVVESLVVCGELLGLVAAMVKEVTGDFHSVFQKKK